jgi:uncharacterized protein (TIGR02284 family)
MQPTTLSQVLNRLYQALQTSQQAYAYAAQHTRNRGLKLVLKSYAQERAQFQEQLQQQMHSAGGDSSALSAHATDGAVGRGWASMRAWFTVRRQSRQRLLVGKALQSNTEAIAVYEEALRNDLPPAVNDLVHRQLSSLYAAERRLSSLAAPRRGNTMLVRLYERPDQAEQVVSALEGAGVTRDQVLVADVERLRPYEQDTEGRQRTRMETMLAAALLGAVLGALILLPFAIALRIYFPQLNGFFANTPTGVLLEYVIGGALVGAIFGLYFSIFIGQDIVEDDAYFYEQSLENGRVLVAVPATANNRPAVEQVLGLQHQFEVKPQAA